MGKRIIDAAFNEYHQYFSGSGYLLPSTNHLHTSTLAFDANRSYINFILIDKCASVFMRERLREIGFRIVEDNMIQHRTIPLAVTFLRNPYDRYISALKWVSVLLYDWSGCNLSLVQEIIHDSLSSNRFILDDHMCPQHIYLDVFTNINEIMYLTLDKNIKDQLNTFLSINISNNDVLNTTDRFNKSSQVLIETCEEQFLKYCINNESFNNLYRKDWDLYNFAITESK